MSVEQETDEKLATKEHTVYTDEIYQNEIFPLNFGVRKTNMIIISLIIIIMYSLFTAEYNNQGISIWVYMLNVPAFNDSQTTPSPYFELTCLSFPQYCNQMLITNLTSIDEFNENCMGIIEYLLENENSLSPLFILSLRREYFFMMMETGVSNDSLKALETSSCHYRIIFDIFKSIHEKQDFHLSEYPILYHTHISKAAGSTAYFGTDILAQITLKLDNKKSKSVIKNGLLNYGGFIFKGVGVKKPANTFTNCSRFYKKIITDYSYKNEKGVDTPPFRVASERPLGNLKLCPQFYNSIILREPLNHRLSMLIFQNQFSPGIVALLCNNGTNKTLSFTKCVTREQMNGFLNALLVNNLSVTITNGDDHRIINFGNFGISVKNGHRFDTSFLIGLLSNTYARWIGYKHSGSDISDAIFASWKEIEKNRDYLLSNSKRILIQYDYVLPIDHDTYSTKHFLWLYYALEIQKKIFNITDEKVLLKHYDWVHRNSNDGRYTYHLHTHGLRVMYADDGELDLLIQFNKIDLELYEYTKQIATVDELFYKL